MRGLQNSKRVETEQKKFFFWFFTPLSYLEFSFAKQLFGATFDFTFVFRYPLREKKYSH